MYAIRSYYEKIVVISLMAILSIIAILKGANIGMKALYGVVALLFVSIIFFLLGNPTNETVTLEFNSTIEGGQSFFYVFTIIFPAFTGIAAGLGLSGDLKEPKISIPRGTRITSYNVCYTKLLRKKRKAQRLPF